MKILVIGQAPPYVNQTVPYDTTLLYTMLEWVGITKESAQDIFEFDAIYNKFPGFDSSGGHLKPSKEQMDLYWEELEVKIQGSNKVLVLGNIAKEYLDSKPKTWSCNLEFVYLIHPSKRNFSRIMENKRLITNELSKLRL